MCRISRPSWFHFAIVAVWLLGHREAMAEEPTFSERIKPILAKYCVDCHGATKPKGELDLSRVGSDESILRERKLWSRLLEYVEAGEMPPDKPGLPKPSDVEIEGFSQAVTQVLARLDCGLESDPGRVTLRRLNRTEYNNTIRNLLGVETRPADDFPSDDVGYGFDNIGDVLTLPPILFEKYVDAAEVLAKRTMDSPDSRRKIIFREPTAETRLETCAGDCRAARHPSLQASRHGRRGWPFTLVRGPG